MQKKTTQQHERTSSPKQKSPERTPHAVPDQQPELNIELVGHVDHGKTTLVSRLSGKWTDTHSEEIKRGITIRLGYATATFYTCEKCGTYGITETCATCKSKAVAQRKVSFIDAPGHESLMATMLSGAAIIDAAILLVSANEDCPQPQTREHLMALEIIGCKNIIIAQNKIDLADEEQVMKNYQQIQEFIKGTVAEHAPIIPLSAQHNVNVDVLIQVIQEVFVTPHREADKEPLMFVARSFDVNRPGTPLQTLVGGVLGGALKSGLFRVGDIIEIRPGIPVEKEGKKLYMPIQTKITALVSGDLPLQQVGPGGSIAVQTQLDPSYVKADSLAGTIAGQPGKLPEVWYEFDLRPELLKRVVGVKEDLEVVNIKKGEALMLNVNSAATVGLVTELKKDLAHCRLKIPVCCSKEDRITISRLLGNRWRLIGVGKIVS